jgi:hypothetical protein
MEHKLAAYMYHIHRMHTLPLMEPKKKNSEMNTISQIAKNNGFPPHSNQVNEQNHRTHHPPNNSEIKH